jgi:hypothetical protein
METSDIPVLKSGGPSSSDILNNINSRIRQDMVTLNANIQSLERSYALTSVYLEQQAVGIQALVSYLQTVMPAATPNRGVADFYTSTFIDPSNTANIDMTFGQATLPIISVQDKMSSIDSQGNVWTPQDSHLRFYSSASYSPGVIPDDSLFSGSVEDQFGIGSQPNTFFLGGYNPTNTYVYVKGVLPQTLNTSTLSNRLTFHPVPAFSHGLVGAYYMDTGGAWNNIDISYLPGYTPEVNPPQAAFLGPTRLHFPPTEILQVCVVLNAYGWWGMQEFDVDLVQYDTSANLAVNMSEYSPTAINTVIVGGKDPVTLSGFNSSVNGSIVTVALSQQQTYASPIITSVDIRF